MYFTDTTIGNILQCILEANRLGSWGIIIFQMYCKMYCAIYAMHAKMCKTTQKTQWKKKLKKV